MKRTLLALAILLSATSGTLIAQSYEKTLTAPLQDMVRSTVLTADGGLIIAGVVESFGNGGKDMMVTRLDASGNILWSKAVGTPADDTCSSVIITADSFIVVLGNTFGGGLGNCDLYVNKLDMNGQLIWSAAMGGVNYDWGVEAVATNDSGFVICGFMNYPPVMMPVISNGTISNTFLRKYDKTGNVVWTEFYATYTCHFIVYDIVEHVNGDLLILFDAFCQVNPPGYQYTHRIMRVNPTGQLLWMKSGYAAYACALAEPDGGTLLIDYSSGQMGTLKIDSAGVPVNSFTYGFTSMRAWAIFPMPGGGYLITGAVQPYQLTPLGLLFFRVGSNGYPLWTKYSRVQLPSDFTGYAKWRSSDASIVSAMTYWGLYGDIAINVTDTLGNTVCANDSMLVTYTNIGVLPVVTTEPMINTAPTMLNGNPVTTAIPFSFTIGSMCGNSNPGNVAETENGGSVKISPNPSDDFVKVDWLADHRDGEIVLYTVTGEVIRTIACTGTTVTIDVSDLSPGMYFIVARSGDRLLRTQKLVVQ